MAALALTGVVSFLAAQARVSLIATGDFENSTPIDTNTWPTSSGGIGQIGSIVNLPGWTRQSVVPDGSDGFAFVMNQDADYNNGSTYPNQGATKFSNAGLANIFLWGPDFSLNPQGNGFSAPHGFIGCQ